MAFTFEEFPDSDYYKSDLREILKYMIKFEKQLDHFQEVIVTFEEAIKDIDSMKNAILALQVATSDLDTIRANIRTIFTDLSGIHTSLSNIYGNLTVIESRIDALKVYIDSENYLLQLDINLRYQQLMNEINSLKAAILAIDTTAVNPWHQELGKVDFQDNIKLMYADLADNVPTAQEYAGLGLTAAEYAEYELPAIEYALRGKKHLHFYWVYSPVYGWKQEISNVLTSIVNDIKDTLTADEYSGLDLTADEYSALNLSALEYFSYEQTNVYITGAQAQQMINNSLVGTVFNSETNTGLTATEYSQLGIKA